MPQPKLSKTQARIRAEKFGLTDELAAIEQEAARKQLALLKRQQRALQARDDFMAFVKFTSPDPEDPNDIERSTYQAARHHRAIARVIEEVERGGIQFLILTMPPRSGKSQLVSRHLPAWYLGKHPERSVVVATYNDDFAKDFGADVRGIVTSSAYKQVFPGARLQRGGTAKDRLQTTQGGMATFVGLGGSLTGRGAHCFPAGTLVWTTHGQIPIECLKDAPASVKAISYDRQTGKLRTQEIEAFASHKAARLLRITTAAGRMVEATPDHPFLTQRGYVQADQLAPGDRLVRAVQHRVAEERIRGQQELGPRAPRVLLRECLLGPPAEPEKARAGDQGMHAMRRAGPARPEAGHAGDTLLLDRVSPESSKRSASRQARSPAVDGMRGVQLGVPVLPGPAEAPREGGKGPDPVLRQAVRKPCALPEHVGGGEPGLSPWTEPSPETAPRGQGLSGGSAGYFRARRGDLRLVLPSRQDARPSLEPSADGQQIGEPGLPVQQVPFCAAQSREIVLRPEEDTVLAVDECAVGAGGVEVFDIQVAEDHNFFANGICCHNCLIVDDIIKSYEEARSKSHRDRAWDWFTKVAMTRRMGPKSVIITFTRWHEDDIIGRLTDPNNEHFSHALARKIKIIDLPAVAGPDDPLGRREGEALWPERYDLDFLEEQRALDPLGFEALYQQRPSVADGVLFRREHVRFYDPADLPDNLRIYCASDHAVTTNQRSDSTVLLKVGVDKQNNIYLLDCWWRKARTPEVVEAMLEMARAGEPPLVWWAEKGHITQSIGPFLRKRMEETGTFINVVDVTPVADKEQRAQSIAARLAMGYVHFPRDKPWVSQAVEQMMAFPNGKHDDFVDTLAWIGLGLRNMVPGGPPRTARKPPRFGTLNWVKEAQRQEELQARMASTGGF